MLHAELIKKVFCRSPFPPPDKYLQLTYKPNNIAVLTIKSFFDGFFEKTGENFSQFLDSAFKDIKNKHAQKLLIDIRGNQGGNDGNGELLYAYLTAKPFLYYAAQETAAGRFNSEDHPNLALQQPKENNFKGKVFILMDGRSFSASTEFSAIVKANSRGKFIGEECGGGYLGNTSGNEAFVTLPNSKIIVRIPTVKYSMAINNTSNNNTSIKPDFPFYKTIVGIVENEDIQMEFGIKVVSEN
jgi:C-terminal processing protease CtpA/Prc